jgi:hypothetical protein
MQIPEERYFGDGNLEMEISRQLDLWSNFVHIYAINQIQIFSILFCAKAPIASDVV